MKHKVVIKAMGNNASGKSYLLRKIKDFLKSKNFKVEIMEDKHEIIVLNYH